MSTQTGSEGEICKALIEADLVDCMVCAAPANLFFTTQIPVCLLVSRSRQEEHPSVSATGAAKRFSLMRGKWECSLTASIGN